MTMTSGPRNFTHNKIDKIFKSIEVPSVLECLAGDHKLQWPFKFISLSYVRDIDKNVEETKIMHACGPNCMVKEAIMTGEVHVMGERVDDVIKLIANTEYGNNVVWRNFSNSDVYLCGWGNFASLCSFDDQWWVVFGVKRTKKKAKTKKTIYLHNPLDSFGQPFTPNLPPPSDLRRRLIEVVNGIIIHARETYRAVGLI